MSSADAVVNNEIFRQDQTALIAMKRETAVMMPGRMLYDAAGYPAGQVVARYTSGVNSGLFGKYNDAGASGLQTAYGILAEPLADAASGSNVAKSILVSGYVFQSKLTGLDAAAIVDLGGRSIYDVSIGASILKF